MPLYRRTYRRKRPTRRTNRSRNLGRLTKFRPMSLGSVMYGGLKKAFAQSMNVRNGVYYFKANVFTQTTFAGNPADPGWSVTNPLTITPSSFGVINECASLFDQYRIVKAWATLTYKAGNVDDIDDVVSPVVDFPTLYWIQDKDDNGAITSNQLQEHAIIRKFQFGNGAKMVKNVAIPCYVKNGIAGIDSSTLVAEQVKRSPWIDFANTSVKHGCTKLMVRANYLSTADDTYKFDIDYHILFECRTVR